MTKRDVLCIENKLLKFSSWKGRLGEWIGFEDEQIQIQRYGFPGQGNREEGKSPSRSLAEPEEVSTREFFSRIVQNVYLEQGFRRPRQCVYRNRDKRFRSNLEQTVATDAAQRKSRRNILWPGVGKISRSWNAWNACAVEFGGTICARYTYIPDLRIVGSFEGSRCRWDLANELTKKGALWRDRCFCFYNQCYFSNKASLPGVDCSRRWNARAVEEEWFSLELEWRSREWISVRPGRSLMRARIGTYEEMVGVRQRAET